MRKLIATVARSTDAGGRQAHDRLIDQLTALEAEGLEAGAPVRTLEAIRAARRTVRVASLIPRFPILRGH